VARRLTVLSVAYPLAPVGPDAVGGAEQILTQIDRALTAAGHRSVVVACEGSRVSGELVATPLPDGPIDEDARRVAQARHRLAIAAVLARRHVDLVHMHGIDFHKYLPDADVPVLATVHMPPWWIDGRQFNIRRQRLYFQCVSAAQRRVMPSSLNVVAVIGNGVDTDALATRVSKRAFALTLGRICPEKGLHLAIDAAHAAAFPLLVAGRVFPYPAHEQYFNKEIAPRLDRHRRFIGPLAFRRKRRLMTAAQCIVVPSLAPETGSLVALEALACGTPVVAFPSGALADLVEDGVTGYLVRTVSEMADAIGASRELSPEHCRAVARARFSSRSMVASYLDLYSGIAGDAGRAQPTRRTPAVANVDKYRAVDN